MIAQATEYLLQTQNQDGGWGYAAGRTTCVEPTAAGLLALTGESAAADACARASSQLQSTQNADGGWGFTAEDSESGWATAWALLALELTDVTSTAVESARNWLNYTPVYHTQDDQLQAEFERLVSIDVNLRGWPWLPDQASWVEPTALAILALSRWPDEGRVAEAVQYLNNRRCDEGGWNFGNPVMLGASLPPRALPTALVLLALSRAAPARISSKDLQALRSDMHRDAGALSLAWGLLALRSLDQEDATGVRMLADQQKENGGWNGNPYHTAVAILAQRDDLPWLKA